MDSPHLNVPHEQAWSYLPDTILLHIFNYLSPSELFNACLTCKNWCRISYDEMLWKRFFYRQFQLPMNTPIAPGKTSWYEEYKRLVYKSPRVCTEVLTDHQNEVLHVSFSHDGTMFATSSKDGLILVWSSSYPASIRFYYDMRVFCWKYTQYSEFNKSDTLLLVSGVNYGMPNSTSGEIAVFSIADGFTLQCRVGNKPYDIFGTWFSDEHLLSGDLFWLAQMISTTGLWINKASPKEASPDHSPILKQLCRFYNKNASSVRVVIVADSASDQGPQEVVTRKPNTITSTLKEKYAAERRCEENGTLPLDVDDSDEDDDLSKLPEKMLIFTTGSQTYTPHQIGFKTVKSIKSQAVRRAPSLREIIAERRERRHGGSRSSEEQRARRRHSVAHRYDEPDHILDLHGHIIGMGLSPDHRFLYVNSRSWPAGYTITDPLHPPPIAQEIDIHVIDLKTFKEVGPVLRSHKAYTPNNECFFIFLDVSEEYVASGAEDKHGYLWDRHYGICVTKLPHENVVNSVAFNPKSPEMLVTTSDDYSIKIWRSKNSVHLLQEHRKKNGTRKDSNTIP